MNSLDKAIELVSRWKADRQKDRAAVAAQLEGAIKDCQTAMQVWQGYLDKPGAPGDQWTMVSWVGPDCAKQLYDIHLRAKEKVEQVCRLAGPQAGRFIGLEEDLVEMAYRQLKPGETGVEAAKSAVEQLKSRMDYLRGLIERVRTAKPANAPVKAPGNRKVAAKKGTPRKVKPGAAKPAKKKASPPKKK